MPQMLSILNRTIHELAFVIHRATPLALACLDVVNKAIGGFYLLLTMIWKDSRKPSEPSPPPSTRLQALENRSTFLRHDGGLQQPRYRQPIQRPYIQS